MGDRLLHWDLGIRCGLATVQGTVETAARITKDPGYRRDSSTDHQGSQGSQRPAGGFARKGGKQPEHAAAATRFRSAPHLSGLRVATRPISDRSGRCPSRTPLKPGRGDPPPAPLDASVDGKTADDEAQVDDEGRDDECQGRKERRIKDERIEETRRQRWAARSHSAANDAPPRRER